MKKFVVLLTFLILFNNIFARSLSENEAKSIASDFLQGVSSSVSRSNEEMYHVTTIENYGKACLYLFNRQGGGYAIISAEDCVPYSVLAYSETGVLDMNNMPEPLLNIIDGFAKEIQNLGTRVAIPPSRSNKSIGPLLKTTWSQGQPYNNMTPKLENGEQSVTGCVNTAQAQVMKYYNWPKQGQGEVSYEWNGQRLYVNLSKSIYDWDNMLDNYESGNYSSEQCDAVALLMRDCGYVNYTDYGVSSGASTNIMGFVENFNYDKSIRYIPRANCTREYYENIMRNEIDEGRPIMVSGGSSGGGHEFVCDGYDESGYFHYNFGWGGQRDGYFLSSATGFDESPAIKIGITPENGGSYRVTVGSNKDFYWDNNYFVWQLERNCFMDEAYELNIELATVTENINSHEKYYTSQYEGINRLFPANGRKNLQPEGIADGDYIVYLMFRYNGGDWERVTFFDDRQSFIDLKVINGIYYYSNSNIKDLIDEGKIEVDGVFYTILDGSTAEVTFKNDKFNSYSGNVIIPSSITIDNSEYDVVRIGQSAFKDCTLENITIGCNVRSIEMAAFDRCSIGNIEFEQNSHLTSIGGWAFNGAELEDIVLPHGIIRIGNAAFQSVRAKSIDIPSSVTSIAQLAFNYSAYLKEVHVHWSKSEDLPSLPLNEDHIFRGCNWEEINLYVPANTADIYRNAPQWSDLNIVENPVTGPDVVFVQEVKFAGNIILAVGEDKQSGAIVVPSNASEGQLIYSVDDENIVLVNEKTGLLHGIKPGTTTLHVSSCFDLSEFATTTVTVTEGSGDGIKVNGPISVLNYIYVTLPTLIKEGVVEGLSDTDVVDYTISCDNSGVVCHKDYFRPEKAGNYTIVFTNNKNPNLSFSLDISVIQAMLFPFSSIYVGESKTVKFDEDCMPLSDYTSIYLKCTDDTDPSSILDADIDIANNQITFKGIGEGQVALYTDTRYGSTFYRINVIPFPSKVLEKKIQVPTNNRIFLSSLIRNKVVDGQVANSTYINIYNVKSSNPAIVSCDSSSGSFMFSGAGTATITFTHKEQPAVRFSIEVTAGLHPGGYIMENLGSLLEGESTTLVIPDTYLPLDYFTSIEPGRYPDQPDAAFGVEINGNKLTFTGKANGMAYLAFISRFVNSTIQVEIATKKVPVEVSANGTATAGSQLGVPVNVQLPENIDVSTTENESIFWTSKDTSIASVDRLTGKITPNGLGKTNITVNKVSEASATSRASTMQTLANIEFWVTQLEMPLSIDLQPGGSEKITYRVNAGKQTYPHKVTESWSSSDADVAEVSASGTVTAKGKGTAVITLTTNIGTREVVVNVADAAGKDRFDINSDGDVNVKDVVSLVDKIIHKTADPAVHDLNGDTFVNVSDIVLLVNEILHGSAKQSAAMRSGSSQEVPMMFDMSRACTAMQTDIIVAEGARIEDVMINAAIARSHSLSYREIEPGRYRVIVFSAGNQPTQLDEDEPLFTLALTGDSGVTTEATVFVDTELVPTAIDSVGEDAEVESVTYFDLQGRKVSAETKGIVIERTMFTNGEVSTRKIKK